MTVQIGDGKVDQIVIRENERVQDIAAKFW